MRLAVIPARGGSKRIPRKNVREFAGRPVIAWPIIAARESGLFDRIICSTDDDEIAAVARRWGAEVPFRRPQSISDDFTPLPAVIEHALDWAAESRLEVDAFCCIFATAALLGAEQLRSGYELMEATGADYCVPVIRFASPIQRAMRITAANRLEMFSPEHFTARSQDLEPAFADAGQFVWGRPDAIRSHVPPLGPQTAALEVPPQSAVDIDTPEDWQRSEALWRLSGADSAAPPAGELNVMITSVSRKLSCVREVRRALHRLPEGGSVIGADSDAGALARGFVDSFWEMPRLDALPVQRLIEQCQLEHIRVIVPTRDGELPYFAEHREALAAAGVEVLISPPATVALCLDKQAFSDRLRELGFAAIPTSRTLDGCDGERLVVKQRFGSGSRSIRLAVDRDAAALAAEDLVEPVFQPWIEGPEYSIDTYSTRDGRAKAAIVRRRVLVVDGESQVTAAVDDPELEALGLDASAAIGLRGPAVWQVIVDPTGAPQIVECNSRIGGASSLSIAMGLDSFYWAFSEAAGIDPDTLPFRRLPTNLRQTRIPCDVIETDSGL